MNKQITNNQYIAIFSIILVIILYALYTIMLTISTIEAKRQELDEITNEHLYQLLDGNIQVIEHEFGDYIEVCITNEYSKKPTTICVDFNVSDYDETTHQTLHWLDD